MLLQQWWRQFAFLPTRILIHRIRQVASMWTRIWYMVHKLGPREFIPKTESRLVHPFSHGAPVSPTHKHTRRPRYSVCSNRPHLCYACKAHLIIYKSICVAPFGPTALERKRKRGCMGVSWVKPATIFLYFYLFLKTGSMEKIRQICTESPGCAAK